MPLNILEQGIGFVKDMLQPEPESIREEIVQPTTTIRQPLPEISFDKYKGAEPTSVVPSENQLEDIDIELPEGISFEEEEPIVPSQGEINQGNAQKIQDNDFGVQTTPQSARKDHFEELKGFENRDKKGLVSTGTDKRFMPIESAEGQGPDKTMSIYEIGYGIKIPKVWLSDNPKNWPIIDGVKTDVRKGFTEDQTQSLSLEILDKSYDISSKKIKTWEDMTEREKSFWADLTYNGGEKAIAKNPKALATTEKGYTGEGMIRALDFIRAGKKRSRGLLNRRISMYNQATLEIPGAPVIEEYKFSDDAVDIKFASDFMTDKVSPKFALTVETKEGWFNLIGKGTGSKAKVFQADKDFNFKR